MIPIEDFKTCWPPSWMIWIRCVFPKIYLWFPGTGTFRSLKESISYLNLMGNGWTDYISTHSDIVSYGAHRGQQGFGHNKTAFKNCNDHVRCWHVVIHSHRLTCVSSRLEYLEMLCIFRPHVEIRSKKGPCLGIAVQTVNWFWVPKLVRPLWRPCCTSFEWEWLTQLSCCKWGKGQCVISGALDKLIWFMV